MKKYILNLTAVFFAIYSFGQNVNYLDVGVIVNDNSEASIQIGEYFKQVRNIPEANMIHIATVTDEQIDTLEFRNIQYQVKSYMEQNELVGKIKYLVTTKGVPFDIAVDSCSVEAPSHSFVYCSSVESELALLFSNDSTEILSSNMVQNPYYSSTSHHSQNPTDLMLVSRLDGKTIGDVLSLIDRSGPQTFVNKEIGKFVFDVSFIEDTEPTFDLFKGMMQPAIDTLNNYGWNTLFDGSYEVPSNLDHVLGFVGCIWSVNPDPLNFTWENGSFAEMIMTPPEFTFYDSMNSLENLLLADLIHEGCVSGSGYIHAYFASQATDYGIFFSRYTDERADAYNLAESYYMATQTLSWMNILVGDPKTTITTVNSSSVEQVSMLSNIRLFPNPAERNVNIAFNAGEAGNFRVLLYDQMGKLQKQQVRFVESGRNELDFDLTGLNPGLYVVRIFEPQSGLVISEKLMLR